jgi:hypothetical protein
LSVVASVDAEVVRIPTANAASITGDPIEYEVRM